jgi:hypothetical protein
MMEVRETALHDLSRLVADDYDLPVVRGCVDAACFRKRSEPNRICSILAERQDAIAAKAQPIAERLFAARPSDVARETLSLWRHWRA